jgi:RimJ/RimL family protein N-acetyltransferase
MAAAARVETARLTLRPLEASDVPALYAIQSDRTAMRYTYAAPSLAECERRLQAYEAQRVERGFAPWVALLRAEGAIVGWGGLGVDPFEPGWGAEVAYFFHPARWGRGFATELVDAALAHGFADHGLAVIGAFAHPDNGASIRVLEKGGFELVRFEPALGRNHYETARAAWDVRRGDR